MHGGCFVWTPTAPLSGRRAPRPGPARVCVCVPCLAGSGGPASRARSGAPHLSFGCSWFALCLFDPSGLGLPCLWLLFFFFFLFPFPPLVAPSLCPALRVFRRMVAWALASCPPPLFFSFFLPPPPVVSGVSCFLVAWGLCAPPPFFFPLLLVFPFSVFFSFFFAPVVRFGAGLCVLGRQVCPSVLRWCRPCRCCVCAGWCCVVFAVGPGCPLLSPGESWCRALVVLSLSGRVACRPVVRRGVSWCSAAVVALCSVLSCACGAGRCFVLLPVVFVCLLLGLAVLCCLLVGPGGSWCRVSVACCGVSLGAVLRRVAARCAAWRCVVVRCVVSVCSVWCCRALRCVLGRCPSSWGPVPSGAVFCLVPPRCVCFAVVCRRVVLFAVVLCAVCALGCRVVRFLSSPPCAVLLCGPLSLGALLPCAVPRGAVLPRGAVVSCPAPLLGLFLAWVWLYLPEKPLQNFVKYFFPLFLAFENKIKLYTTQHTRVQQDHVRCSALRATRGS